MVQFGPETFVLIGIILLLLFGARKLPELARSMGQARGEYEIGKLESEQRLEAQRARGRKIPPPSSKIVRTAKQLGIPTEGKTSENLRQDIATKLAQDDGDE